MMDVLWAGWRSTYMGEVQAGTDTDACLFCELPSASDEDAYILERGETAFSVLNLYPYTSGHLMITPFRHAGMPGELTSDEQSDVWRLLSRSQAALADVLGPHGYNLGANLGRAGGAGVLGHFHLHVVPRWSGDANFMTATANARILPEPLIETWQKLRVALDA
ncbi:MAG: HIT domain-containing protein [Acidimicrobiia bacterium]|nr:HIT domain-containing protein [Acidimicrobiia bacterium]NNL68834.1 HIT domain-containing protein [Acidimicrobiia bacterium]